MKTLRFCGNYKSFITLQSIYQSHYKIPLCLLDGPSHPWFVALPKALWRRFLVLGSTKKYKCTLQVGPLFWQIHTNLNPLKSLQVPVRSLQLVFTMVSYWIQSVMSRKFTCALYSCKKLLIVSLLNWPREMKRLKPIGLWTGRRAKSAFLGTASSKSSTHLPIPLKTQKDGNRNIYSAAQRHANIKTRLELVQLACVNAFHYKCAFKRAHSLFMVRAFTTRSYCYSCYSSRSWKRWHSKTNAFQTRFIMFECLWASLSVHRQWQVGQVKFLDDDASLDVQTNLWSKTEPHINSKYCGTAVECGRKWRHQRRHHDSHHDTNQTNGKHVEYQP